MLPHNTVHYNTQLPQPSAVYMVLRKQIQWMRHCLGQGNQQVRPLLNKRTMLLLVSK